MLRRVVELLDRRGLTEIARRLERPGAEGFPGIEGMQFFAEVVGGAIQVVPLTFGSLQPPSVYGNGAVFATVGHVILSSGSGHYVLLDAPNLDASTTSSSSS